jgi:hypothetical protein
LVIVAQPTKAGMSASTAKFRIDFPLARNHPSATLGRAQGPGEQRAFSMLAYVRRRCETQETGAASREPVVTYSRAFYFARGAAGALVCPASLPLSILE